MLCYLDTVNQSYWILLSIINVSACGQVKDFFWPLFKVNESTIDVIVWHFSYLISLHLLWISQFIS